MSGECPDLRVFSARPGAVDSGGDAAVAAATVGKRGKGLRRLEGVVIPVMRMLYPGMVSPTKDLGAVLTQLAVGDGERLEEGPGVSGEGRTIGNVRLRKMAGL